jgi:hypothetical protein
MYLSRTVCGFNNGSDINLSYVATELFYLPLDNRGYVLTSYCHRTLFSGIYPFCFTGLIDRPLFRPLRVKLG